MDLGHPQRPPPSYNQAVALHPPGARTVSGSDTDVSTSAENLTHEEKYVLSHTERQDPQGEENLVKTTLTGADFATPAGAMEWVKSVEKALKRPMGPPTGRPPPQYPRPGSAAAAAAAAAAAGQLPYSSLERLLGQRDVNGPAQVNGKEMKPPAMGGGGAGGGAAGGGGGTMSDKSNSSSSSQLAPAEGSSTGYDAGGAAGARADKSPLSRSQPDLNRNGPGDPLRPPGQYREPPDYVAANAHEMMQILMLENSTLKQELDVSQRKVQKLQKFARELEKLQSDYDDLVRTCQRREQLEFMARQKLTSEVRRATDLNNSLSSQLDTSKLDEGKKQTDRRELLIQQLVTQNKELQAVKERQEIELTAQRATLQEQRQYIDILDTALSKAQENVVRVEKEHSERLQTQYVERGTFVERVAQLQRALTSCQLAADRRETAHKKVRADLEREMAELKAAVAGKQGDDSGGSRQAAELADLRQKLRDANERILLLETELAHCQQKFVESARENELMLERSLPPRLEPPPPSHQLRHMSHGAQAHASMEERVLGLEARLVEKDAMIRALQKHALEVPALMRSSPHSRQSSLQSLAGVNSSYGMSQHGYSSSAYSSSSGARPPGSTNAGSMINMNRLHTVSSTPLSAEPRGAVSMASLSADISLLNASLASASLGSTAPTTAVTSAAVSAPHPAHSAASASPSHAASASASALDTGASILQALQKDREVFPEHYWHV